MKLSDLYSFGIYFKGTSFSFVCLTELEGGLRVNHRQSFSVKVIDAAASKVFLVWWQPEKFLARSVGDTN